MSLNVKTLKLYIRLLLLLLLQTDYANSICSQPFSDKMSSLKEKLQAHSIPSLQYLCVAYSGLEFGVVVSGFQYLAGCVFLSYTAT